MTCGTKSYFGASVRHQVLLREKMVPKSTPFRKKMYNSHRTDPSEPFFKKLGHHLAAWWQRVSNGR